MRQAAAESERKGPGGDAMLERLSEMMFIDAVRRYLGTLPDESAGWLAVVRDRFVGRALDLMHEAPALDWSVDELSRRVGLPVGQANSLSPKTRLLVGGQAHRLRACATRTRRDA